MQLAWLDTISPLNFSGGRCGCQTCPLVSCQLLPGQIISSWCLPCSSDMHVELRSHIRMTHWLYCVWQKTYIHVILSNQIVSLLWSYSLLQRLNKKTGNSLESEWSPSPAVYDRSACQIPPHPSDSGLLKVSLSLCVCAWVCACKHIAIGCTSQKAFFCLCVRACLALQTFVLMCVAVLSTLGCCDFTSQWKTLSDMHDSSEQGCSRKMPPSGQ